MAYQEVLGTVEETPNTGRLKWNANDEELFGLVEDLETTTGALDGRLDTAETTITSLDGRLDTIEAGYYNTAAEVLAALLTVDGPGSGLNADLLDGLSSADFAPIAHVGAGGTAHANAVAAGAAGFMTGADKTKLDGIETAATADMTAAELLTAIKTVDGSGSGLDADLLDGLSSADFAPIAHVGAGGAAHANAVASGAAGFLTGTDKAKLDGIASAAGVAKTVTAELSAQAALTGSTGSTYVKIPFNQVLAGTAGLFNTSTNRFNLSTAGWWLIGATVAMTNIAVDSIYRIALFKNGSQYKVIDTDQSSHAASPVSTSGSIPVLSDGDDYVEIFGNTGSASDTPNIAAASYAYAIFLGT